MRRNGLGPFQKRILDHLHTPEPQAFTTSELAHALLGSTDREAVRHVRRTVDNLARRGLVNTWTGPAGSGASSRWGDGDEDNPHIRIYLRPMQRGCYDCHGPNCKFCAAGDEPRSPKGWYRRRTGEPVDNPIHTVALVHAYKSRVRWVELRWGCRPAKERVRITKRWIRDGERALAEHFPDGEPADGDGLAGFSHWRWQRITDVLAQDRRLLAEAYADQPLTR
jgi:hypothetical protein